MKRWLIVAGIGVALLGIFLFWRAKAASAQKATVTTATVKRTSFVKTVQSSGKTKAKKDVELKFQTSGKLTWVGVAEGDHVRAYQAIAGLDPREVQKNLEKALRDYSKERNDFEEWNHVTNPICGDQGLCSDSLKRILQDNQWDLDKAVLDVELKHLAVEYATLVSPIDGIVTHIDTPVAGVNITPASAVFEVIDPTSLIFEASVDETDVGSLTVGQQATIALDAYPDQTFPSTVSYISYAAVTSSGGATVFPVQVSLSTDKPIRVGMNGDVTITTQTQENALVIPIDAVREDEKGSYVYKKTGDKYVKTPVKLGSQNEDSAVILSGLSEGDAVVTKGFASVQ